MSSDRQKSLAETFRRLHHGPNLLVLANCWDVASARVLEAAGAPAIATSSAGVAFSLGYPDGQRISREEMLAVVARVAKAVKVPVTADVESGYGPRPEDAARTAGAVIEAGAVGMNLEDSTEESDTALIDLSLALEKIHAVREAGQKAGVKRFVYTASNSVVMGGQLFRGRYVQVEADVWGVGRLMDAVSFLDQIEGIGVAGILWNRDVIPNTQWVSGLV